MRQGVGLPGGGDGPADREAGTWAPAPGACPASSSLSMALGLSSAAISTPHPPPSGVPSFSVDPLQPMGPFPDAHKICEIRGESNYIERQAYQRLKNLF